MRFSLARREIEASWGVHNLEVPLSEVCETDGFYWFVSHLLAQLPRYSQVHNEALSEYRAAAWDPQQEPSGRRTRDGRGVAARRRSGSGGRGIHGAVRSWSASAQTSWICASPAKTRS